MLTYDIFNVKLQLSHHAFQKLLFKISDTLRSYKLDVADFYYRFATVYIANFFNRKFVALKTNLRHNSAFLSYFSHSTLTVFSSFITHRKLMQNEKNFKI